MIAYINHNRHRDGVEPICRLLPIAPSTYHDATRRPSSARALRDRQLKVEITRVHAEHFGVYGAGKVWRQPVRPLAAGRCRVDAQSVQDPSCESFVGADGAMGSRLVDTSCEEQHGYMTTTEAACFVRHPDYELLQARYVHHRFGLHAHDSFVLAVVEDGAEGLRVGDTRLVAYPGDVVLFGPGEAHDGWAHDGRGFSYRAVYPSRDLVARAVGLPPAGAASSYFRDNVITDPQLADGLRRAHGWLSGGGDALDSQAALAPVLELLFDRYGASDLDRRQVVAETAAVARDLIDSRVVEPVRLQELARACDATPLRVLRAFRAAYGLPPHRYQLQRRVQLAQGRLRAGADLAALAAELGFADQSHLTRMFKSVVGVSPGAYQRAAAARR
jgi:AraC-like DNA-binding protein